MNKGVTARPSGIFRPHDDVATDVADMRQEFELTVGRTFGTRSFPSLGAPRWVC
jgi:hypothetical protein